MTINLYELKFGDLIISHDNHLYFELEIVVNINVLQHRVDVIAMKQSSGCEVDYYDYVGNLCKSTSKIAPCVYEYII